MTDRELEQQVAWWQSVGCRAMKIKIGESWGSRTERDLARVERLRELAGAHVDLMVDANGGYRAKHARRVGHHLDDLGVVWFEEPVSSDDPAGLARLRAELRCDVTAGEYAADVFDTAGLVNSVDCLQLDATRCGGYTGLRRCAAIAAAHNLDVSAHCAPALHAAMAAALPHLRHIEWFADHVRVEEELVDGAPQAHDGALWPDPHRPGHGMTLSARATDRRVA
jgi:L-alanine-DL-glutamate epimerase-like enolase superfamily enzyme